MDIYNEIVQLRNSGRTCAIATIVECRGSSPQKQGAKMLVRDDGSLLGTLGGGCLEADVRQAALMAMRDKSPLTLPFELTEKEGGLVCGGAVLVYIEPVLPVPHVVILGAGHVGKALAGLAKFGGFRATVVDDRREYANPEHVPEATDLIVKDFGSAFEDLSVGEETFVVVATRGHNHDLDAVKAALRTGAGYIGLLGSRRKKALLFKALRESGIDQEDVDRVITPVGLDIGSRTPEEIGISIMAQIIERRNTHGGMRRIGPAACGGLLHEDGATETAPSSRG
jgi:xanthine dehydrogenase accessory factor